MKEISGFPVTVGVKVRSEVEGVLIPSFTASEGKPIEMLENKNNNNNVIYLKTINKKILNDLLTEIDKIWQIRHLSGPYLEV